MNIPSRIAFAATLLGTGLALGQPAKVITVPNALFVADITPDGTTVVVASEDSGTVTLIDTATQTPSTILLAGAKPRDVDLSDDGLLAYVPSGDRAGGNDGVYVIDVVAQMSTGMIDLGGETNPNVVTVAPQLVHCAP